MAKHGEKNCARILGVYFTYSYFVRMMCERDSCLSLQQTWNTNSQRHKFPQQHYSGSKGLCASAAENLIFPSSGTPKFRSLYQKCSGWAPSSLLSHSSASWDLTAASFPLYFTSCLQIIWITAQVTATVHLHQLGRWEGRKKVTIQLMARMTWTYLEWTAWWWGLSSQPYDAPLHESLAVAWMT